MERKLVSIIKKNILVFLILFIAFILRIININFPLGDYDEGVYISTIRSVLNGYPLIESTYTSQFPLFIDIGKYFYLINPSIGFLRLFPILSSLVIIYVTFILIKKYSNIYVAAFASIYLSVNSYFLITSRSFQTDIPWVAFTVLSFYYLLKFHEKPNYKNLVLSAITLGVSIMIKANPIFVIATIIYFVLYIRRYKENIIKYICVYLLIIFLISLFLINPHNYSLLYNQALHQRTNHIVFTMTSEKISLFKHEFLLLFLDLLGIVVLIRDYIYKYKKDFHEFLSNDYFWMLTFIWVFTTGFIFTFYNPLFPHHFVFFILPSILFSCLILDRVRRNIFIHIFILLIILYSAFTSPNIVNILNPYKKDVLATTNLITKYVDDHSKKTDYIITDSPILSYITDRSIPPYEVDPSFVRIDAGDLDEEKLIQDTKAFNVRFVIYSTGRFNLLPKYTKYLENNLKKLLLNNKITIYEKG